MNKSSGSYLLLLSIVRAWILLHIESKYPNMPLFSFSIFLRILLKGEDSSLLVMIIKPENTFDWKENFPLLGAADCHHKMGSQQNKQEVWPEGEIHPETEAQRNERVPVQGNISSAGSGVSGLHFLVSIPNFHKCPLPETTVLGAQIHSLQGFSWLY